MTPRNKHHSSPYKSHSTVAAKAASDTDILSMVKPPTNQRNHSASNPKWEAFLKCSHMNSNSLSSNGLAPPDGISCLLISSFKISIDCRYHVHLLGLEPQIYLQI